MKPHYFILLMSLLVDGGTVVSQPSASGSDGGTVVSQPSASGSDEGPAARWPTVAEGIRWPDEIRPLATLDGPAVLAAHAALQRLVSSFPKEYVGTCSYSAKGLEVLVGEEGGLYFVEIRQRLDKCGPFAPGFNAAFDWFELYAVSPDGKVLARYPYFP